GVDELLADGREPVPAEEVGLEGEAEQSAEPEVGSVALELLEQCMPDALAQPGLGDRDRADLAEVLPDHVQCPAADELAVGRLGHPELLAVFEQRHALLAQQDASLDVGVDDLEHSADVGRARVAHPEGAGHPISLRRPPHPWASASFAGRASTAAARPGTTESAYAASAPSESLPGMAEARTVRMNGPAR